MKIKGSYVACLLLLISAAVTWCNEMTFQSPEANYMTLQKAIKNKDKELFISCFKHDGNLFTRDSLSTLSEIAFYRVKTIHYEILEKHEDSPSTARLLVKEVNERSSNTRYTSKIRIEYVKTEEGWKITCSETIEFKPVSKE